MTIKSPLVSFQTYCVDKQVADSACSSTGECDFKE